jgi:HAD superfamily hydrolase (TIGR01509 family)
MPADACPGDQPRSGARGRSPGGTADDVRSECPQGRFHGATHAESHFPDTPDPLPAAVLWDLDGTLIDSEKVWDVSLADTARWLGGELSPRARARVVGAELGTASRVLVEEAGLDATSARVGQTCDYLVARTAALFGDGVSWRPGAREALDAVHAAGVPMALVTNSQRVLTEIALDVIGRHWFGAVVCGDEVTHGKPAPEPYLRAAELLDVPIDDCVAVEDSPAGALSAERAGAAVLVVPCDVPVPGGPRRTHRDGLVGLTAADLAAAVQQQPDDAVTRVA